MTKKNKAYVVLFLLLLVMPAIFANFSKEAISSIDNRKLTEYKFESLEKVSANVDSFAKDRVGFREAMINGYSIFNNQLFDVMVHPYYSCVLSIKYPGIYHQDFPDSIKNHPGKNHDLVLAV